ncbi:alpha-amylase family glycosyl hydrolase [Mesomycoplasma molare]|uniref:Alpha-amylase family glycosyl hydrolase n=1 Tax=Mesomycoplasma molare TaxID=171288 RepID=A0ABY5TU44_9BACT|nr:alpha-amylase family glycosyl hydrolase [Mesomycoplasma molare]UWD34183.1 alpha-amylase family glycosyl hydrolase [Mesomycoplasma molare]
MKKNIFWFSKAFLACAPLSVISCANVKETSAWGDEKFYKEFGKLTYSEDDEKARFIAPFSKTEKTSSVIYQVLVYAFADGNNDGIGDFIGLKNNLDYFSNLGIDQLYLSPIHPASSYHGYDVIDYTDVAEELGGKEAFNEFLIEAHKRGIKVYLDLIFNHTSFEHPWFQKALSGDQKYQNFYRFYDTKIADTNQDTEELRNLFPNLKNKQATNKYYTSKFWAGMPDLNLDNPEVIKELKHIQSYWTKLGVDGFRYDAFVEFFSSERETKNNYNESKIFYELREASNEALKSINRDQEIFMMGEWWNDTLSAKEYLSFDNQKALGTVYDGQHWKNNWFVTIDNEELKKYLKQINEELNTIWVPFLTNHDVDRWINSYRLSVGEEPLQVGDLDKPLREKDIEAIKNAYFYLLVMPATPIIYHGDELMLHANKKFGDSGMREPFKWKDYSKKVEFKERKNPNDIIKINFSIDTPFVEEQVTNNNSVYSTIKFLLNFRKEHNFMYSQNLQTIGNASEYIEEASDNTIVRQSIDGSEKYLFINSLGDAREKNFKIKNNNQFEVIYNKDAKIENNTIKIEKQGMIILKIK